MTALLALWTMTLAQIEKFLKVDSLAYLSVEGLMKAVQKANKGDLGYCDACFTGNYPVTADEDMSQEDFDWQAPAPRTG